MSPIAVNFAPVPVSDFPWRTALGMLKIDSFRGRLSEVNRGNKSAND
jgi:hypothetical protein